jgi:hypothetical protein
VAPAFPEADAAERPPEEQRRLWVEIQSAHMCAVARLSRADAGGDGGSLQDIFYEVLRRYGATPLEYGNLAARFRDDPEVEAEVNRRMMECYAPDAGGGPAVPEDEAAARP